MDTAVALLVLDDEVLIADLLKETLEEGGFQVVAAYNVEEGLDRLETMAQDGLAGLITDVNLGSRITGWDVAKRARELRPDLPIVYTSGYAADDWAVNGVPHSLVVRKPFAPAQVVTAIATLMNRASSQTTPPSS